MKREGLTILATLHCSALLSGDNNFACGSPRLCRRPGPEEVVHVRARAIAKRWPNRAAASSSAEPSRALFALGAPEQRGPEGRTQNAPISPGLSRQ